MTLKMRFPVLLVLLFFLTISPTQADNKATVDILRGAYVPDCLSAVDNDFRTLATLEWPWGGKHGEITLYDIGKKSVIAKITPPAGADGIASMKFTENGQLIVCSSQESQSSPYFSCTLQKLDLKSKQWLPGKVALPNGFPTISEDGAYAIWKSADADYRRTPFTVVADLKTGEQIRIDQDCCSNFAISPDGKYFAAQTEKMTDGQTERELRVFSLPHGQLKQTIPSQDRENYYPLSLSSNNKLLAVSETGKSRLIDLDTGQEIRTRFYQDSKPIISRSGKLMAIARYCNGFEVRDTKDGTKVSSYEGPGIQALKFFDNEKKAGTIFSFSQQGGKFIHRVRIWDIYNRKEVLVWDICNHKDLLVWNIGESPIPDWLLVFLGAAFVLIVIRLIKRS